MTTIGRPMESQRTHSTLDIEDFMEMARPDTFAGAAVYVPVFLRCVYDPVVLGLYCPYAWKIQLTRMRESFNRHIAHSTSPLRSSSPIDGTSTGPGSSKNSPCRILDIVVGTRYFFKHAPLPTGSEMHIVDLNRSALHAAKSRTMAAHPTTTCQMTIAGFLDTEGKGLRRRDLGSGSFDAISTMMLLHCLPGPPERKAGALVHLRHLLAPKGTLFGMKILGRDVKHKIWRKQLMFWHNLMGLFGNTEDDVEGFIWPLKEAFGDVSWEIHGKILLFEARKPKIRWLVWN